jgi:hypothetical protein
MRNLDDFMRTVFALYCIYAVYCCLVIFSDRPNNPASADIFRRLHIPVVIFIYFLVPCVALFLAYRAFWGIHSVTFWVATGAVFALSFFIMLYFLTDPEWPVGQFLQLEKMPIKLVLVLLSANLAVSVVVVGASALALRGRPAAIHAGPREKEFRIATENLKKLQGEEKTQEVTRRSIQREATSTVFEKYGDFLKVFLPLITAVVTFITSMVTLLHKK